MSRAELSYDRRREWVKPEGYGVSPEQPEAGYYRMRLRSGGQPVGVHIWFGAPHDPVTGEEMDRSHRWQAHINGEYVEMERVWPVCAHERITEIEYNRMLNLQVWAREHAPETQIANPRMRPDPLKTPSLF